MMCKIGAMRLAPPLWEAHSRWGEGWLLKYWCMTIPTYNLFAEWRKSSETTWNHVVIPAAASLDARASCWQVPQCSECTSLHLEVSLEFSGSVCSPPHTSCHVEQHDKPHLRRQVTVMMLVWIVAQELHNNYLKAKQYVCSLSIYIYIHLYIIIYNYIYIQYIQMLSHSPDWK